MSPFTSAGVLALALVTSGGAALAQDPILDGYQPEPSAWHHHYGDLSMSSDHVEGLPNRDDVDRLRARLRLGWRGAGGSWEYALAGKLGAGTDRNRDNLRNNDNERSDAVSLDEAWWRWQPAATAFQVGKARLPLSLTPMLWDNDLRPVGAFAQRDWELGFDRLRATAGYFAGDHLYGDRSRIATAQLGWHWREGAPWSLDLQLGWLHFTRLETAAGTGLTRTNRRIGSRLVSDYRLLDLQFGSTWQIDGKPLAARLDLVRNLGADDLDRGARGSLVYGHADALPGWEFGFSYQRIQRDAVQAAFNSDDWWFHSAARGGMPWIGYGFTSGWALQVSWFHERRDGERDQVDRILAELRRRF